jgi:hypothetical protein
MFGGSLAFRHIILYFIYRQIMCLRNVLNLVRPYSYIKLVHSGALLQIAEAGTRTSQSWDVRVPAAAVKSPIVQTVNYYILIQVSIGSGNWGR